MKHIPKVELHRHLELSIRDSTMKELAPKFGFDLSAEGSFEHHFKIKDQMNDLGAVLHKFLDTQKLLATEEILERVAYEACEDAWNEGVKVLELRYAPSFVALDHPELSWDSIHKAFVKGCEKAEKEFGMATGLVCILQRILSPEENEKITDFAIANKDTFVGMDLADNEIGFDPKPFSKCFEKAKKAGLKITIHAGEAAVAGSERNILDSVNYLHASRIGHGLQCYRDPEVLKFVIDNQIPLEICPTSNVLTKAVEKIEDHPIKKLIAAGVFVTINSDDPGIFDQNLLEEYELLKEKFDFTEDELIKLGHKAAQVSFINREKVQKAWPYDLNIASQDLTI